MSVRKIRVNKFLIEEFFRDGLKRAHTLSNGISDNHYFFKVDTEGDDVCFWFLEEADIGGLKWGGKTKNGPRQLVSKEVQNVDDTPTMLTVMED